MKYTPTLISDCEIIVSSLSVNNSCLGTKKTEKDIMISITHDHGKDNNTVKGYENKGYCDLFLTKEQAWLLKMALEERLSEIY